MCAGTKEFPKLFIESARTLPAALWVRFDFRRAMIAALDDGVGRILDLLEEMKIRDHLNAQELGFYDFYFGK
jgi:hypothetical protein